MRRATGTRAAKAAIVNLTKALAQEFGAKGVRVNAVSPDTVRTALRVGPDVVAETLAKASGSEWASVAGRIAAVNQIAPGRTTGPEEVAALVTFLASEQAASKIDSTNP